MNMKNWTWLMAQIVVPLLVGVGLGSVIGVGLIALGIEAKVELGILFSVLAVIFGVLLIREIKKSL